MKFLLPIFFLTIVVPAFAQENKILVQGEYVDVLLVDFLSDIEQKNNIKFHYVNDVLKDVRVTGSFKNKTDILVALDILLTGLPISCADNGEGGIVLFADSKKLLRKADKYFTISGKIIDGRGEGIPFASALLVGPGKGAITDEHGNFKIKLVMPGRARNVR